MSPGVTTAGEPPTSAGLRTATAKYNASARCFEIAPTSWGTHFDHRRIIHAAFPWGPIDAYFERPLSGIAEGKLLDASVSMIQIEASHEVGEGAFLARVYGDEEVWMLHLPPQPLAAGIKGREKGKAGGHQSRGEGSQGATATEGRQGKVKQRAVGMLCPDFRHFLNRVNKMSESAPSYLDDFFAAYALDVGSGITPNDVRIDFANEIADANSRAYFPEENDAFWEELWQLVTRRGALDGPASSHWKKGYDIAEPPLYSAVEKARARSHQDYDHEDIRRQYCDSMAHATTQTMAEDDLATIAAIVAKDEFRRGKENIIDDGTMDGLWALLTRRGTLEGVPKHWNDKGGVQRETDLDRAKKGAEGQQGSQGSG